MVPGEACSVGSSAVAGVAFGFYPSGPYPADYDGALFFADNTRDCIWVMKRNGGALPSPSSLSPFVQRAANPVDVQIAPSGELFYVDFERGHGPPDRLHRRQPAAGRGGHAPTGRRAACR